MKRIWEICFLAQFVSSLFSVSLPPLSSSFLRINASFENPTPRNMSSASSTIDQTFAVGAPATKEEQTINTQFALRELSMMFSSPAFGLNESKATIDDFCCHRQILDNSCASERCSLPNDGEINVASSPERETHDRTNTAHHEPVNDNGVEKDKMKPGFEIYEDC